MNVILGKQFGFEAKLKPNEDLRELKMTIRPIIGWQLWVALSLNDAIETCH